MTMTVLQDRDLDYTPEELWVTNTLEHTNDPTELAYMMLDKLEEGEDLNSDLCAQKILELYGAGRATLDHLTVVGNHANEPYKSEAIQIIRNR
jgi:hypothetical protein